MNTDDAAPQEAEKDASNEEPELPEGGTIQGAVEATSFALRRREVGSRHLQKLRQGLPVDMPLLLLPELFDLADTDSGVDHLSQALDDEAGW